MSIRVPLDLYKDIEQSAKENGRSLNKEIIWRLRHCFRLTQEQKKSKGK